MSDTPLDPEVAKALGGSPEPYDELADLRTRLLAAGSKREAVEIVFDADAMNFAFGLYRHSPHEYEPLAVLVEEKCGKQSGQNWRKAHENEAAKREGAGSSPKTKQVPKKTAPKRNTAPDPLKSIIERCRANPEAAFEPTVILHASLTDPFFRDRLAKQLAAVGVDEKRWHAAIEAFLAKDAAQAEEDRKASGHNKRRAGNSAKTFELTDMGNAERLVDAHGADLRWSSARGWLVWDGTRWVRDETLEVVWRAKETVRSVLIEAAMSHTTPSSKWRDWL